MALKRLLLLQSPFYSDNVFYMRKQTEEHIRKKALAKRRGSIFGCEVCGTQFWRKPYEISKGNNRFCSKDCYFVYQKGRTKDLSNRRVYSGENNPNWKGGIASESIIIWRSSDMNKWRKSVFERDSWTCRSCGNKSMANNYLRIEAHHIKPFATFPEVRFCIGNGLTLCKKCHDKEAKGKEVYNIK